METIEQKKLLKALYNKIAFHTFILFLLLGVLFITLSPIYDEYSQNKELLLTKIQEYEKIQKQGISFSELTASLSDSDTKTLVEKIGSDFFAQNFKNTTPRNYVDFLKEKAKKISDLKRSDIIKNRDAKLARVLPAYQEGISVDGSMTDLEFINYIENLLRAFRLRTSSKIGIGDVLLLDKKSSSDKQKPDTFASQIFYIPLKLDLEGAKSDIVDFLYFLQNVGKVESVKENDIVFYKDGVLSRDFGKLAGNNIYENKVVDIESIEMNDYIETSSLIRTTSSQKKTLGLLSFIKNGVEKDQAYAFTVDLRFYVKGLPTYKIESYITKTVQAYKDAAKKTTESLNKIKSTKGNNINTDLVNIVSNLTSIDLYLKDNQSTIKKLEGGLKQKTNYEKLYIDAAKLRYDLDNIASTLNENINKIQTLKTK